MDERTAKLIKSMISHDKGDTLRIQHFLKVHDLAVTIGIGEELEKETLDILEAASILHDIGIHPSEEKYGNCAGVHQEELGPGEADTLLNDLNSTLPDEMKYSQKEIDSIKFLIGHHHTYQGIDRIEWQILVEADFLVNLFENGSPTQTIRDVEKNIFKTATGLSILKNMFNY